MFKPRDITHEQTICLINFFDGFIYRIVYTSSFYLESLGSRYFTIFRHKYLIFQYYQAGVSEGILETLSEDSSIRSLLSKLEVAIDALDIKWRQDNDGSGKWRPVVVDAATDTNRAVSGAAAAVHGSKYRPSPFSQRPVAAAPPRRGGSSCGIGGERPPMLARDLAEDPLLLTPPQTSIVIDCLVPHFTHDFFFL